MATKNRGREVERRAGKESEDAKPTPRVVGSSPRTLRSALNRLIVAGRSEVIALDAAARVVDGAQRRAALRAQAERRVLFRRDLCTAVKHLGGIPAEHAALGARLAAAVRRLSTILIGPHAGDAYATCARATERAASAYSTALSMDLPADMLFGVERQFADVEWDRRELRRLRWGASLTPLPDRSPRPTDERPQHHAASETEFERVIEVSSDDGGRSANGPSNERAGSSLVGAIH